MSAPNFHITTAYPVELHYVKALLLQKRYRQCIQACRDNLKTAGNRIEDFPLQQTFISFYLGLAHDELARLMHDYSQAKIPAFFQAEKFYRETLESLPDSGKPYRVDYSAQAQEGDDPFFDRSTASPPRRTVSVDDDYDPFNYSSPPQSELSPISPPTHLRTDSLPARSPPTASRETSASDLESHASFDQIMTPHKVLQGDVSRMSLLDDLPKQPIRQSLLRNNTSQGLMRPIRPGSPPTAFHVPPRLPYVRSAVSTSRLPRLSTRVMQDSPSRRIPSAIAEEWEDPPAAVSPLGSEGALSETSTISPVSPETPVRESEWDSPSHQEDGEDKSRYGSIDEHLLAMRTQLETHLRLLEKAKLATLSAQAARIAERASAAPTAGTSLAPVRGSVDGAVGGGKDGSRPGSASSRHDSVFGESKRLPQMRSFWSFTPQDVKAQELRKRVEAGRERGWVKEKFRPERYVELAERALAEL